MAGIIKSLKELKWYEWLMAAIMIIIAARAMILAFGGGDEGNNPAWLAVLNFISAVCGVACVFFTAKAHISNFPFAIVNTIAYAIYLAYWRIYGTFLLELVVYLPIEIISWKLWLKHRDEQVKERAKIRRLTALQNLEVTIIIAECTCIYHYFLVRAGGNVAWLDAATVAIGLAATFLSMLRYREQYIWWLITDFVAVAMYIARFDPVYLTKKSIYLIMAIIGLINWIKLSRMNKSNE